MCCGLCMRVCVCLNAFVCVACDLVCDVAWFVVVCYWVCVCRSVLICV